jgi:hypothetical protein
MTAKEGMKRDLKEMSKADLDELNRHKKTARELSDIFNKAIYGKPPKKRPAKKKPAGVIMLPKEPKSGGVVDPPERSKTPGGAITKPVLQKSAEMQKIAEPSKAIDIDRFQPSDVYDGFGTEEPSEGHFHKAADVCERVQDAATKTTRPVWRRMTASQERRFEERFAWLLPLVKRQIKRQKNMCCCCGKRFSDDPRRIIVHCYESDGEVWVLMCSRCASLIFSKSTT